MMFVIDGVKVGSILEDVEEEEDTAKAAPAKPSTKPAAPDKGAQ